MLFTAAEPACASLFLKSQALDWLLYEELPSAFPVRFAQCRGIHHATTLNGAVASGPRVRGSGEKKMPQPKTSTTNIVMYCEHLIHRGKYNIRIVNSGKQEPNILIMHRLVFHS